MALAVAEQETVDSQSYIFVDDIPELAEIREQERQSASALMATRETMMFAAGDKPQPIYALTSAERVLTAQVTHGEDSQEYVQAQRGLFHDALRLVGEWRRKNKDSYFKPIRHERDHDNNDFLADGYSTDAMTSAALLPSGFAEQDERTINERVEEVTTRHAQKIGSLVLGKSDVRLRTISECTDWSIDIYNKTGESLGGYVPEIQKVMIRDFTFDQLTGDRLQEQIGLPGTYLNHYVFQEALRRRDVNAKHMDKTALHGAQMFVDDDIFEFVKLLDEVASEEWCVNIFMGELWPEGAPKDYALVKQQAIERETELHEHAAMVADFVLSLAEQKTPNEKAVTEVEEFVKQMLITMSQEDLSITTDMFDKATADRLVEVQYLQAMGQLDAAREMLIEAVREAPGGGYCGAGSCDLERAKTSGEEAEKLRNIGFDPKDTLMDKGDRKCKGCGEKTVAYQLRKKQKGCTSCGATAKY